MRLKHFYMLMIVVIVVGNINLASAQELGRKGARKSRYTAGLAIGNRSYLDSDFFKDHPDELEPGDLRGNSYNVFFESTPPPGFFGVEFLASLDPSSADAPKTGTEHRLQSLVGRLSGKIHPFANAGMGQYFDLYFGVGATGISLNYEISGASESYKAFGPHALAGFEYYLGTFSEGNWRWGAFFDYLFTSVKLERVVRNAKNLEDRADFNAGGHLFIFGIKFNAFR